MGTRIIVFSDLHTEIIDNAKERVDEIINYAQKSEANYIINMGDFGYWGDTSISNCRFEKMPINLKNSYSERTSKHLERAMRLFKQFNQLEMPIFSIFGNHDLDFANKQAVKTILQMPNNYYSKNIQGIKFIFLDSSSYLDEHSRIIPYENGNYFNGNYRAVIDSAQMEWLKYELLNWDREIIILAHYPLYDVPRAVNNHKEITQLISQNNKILAVINGHVHHESITSISGVDYISLNSSSYKWIGEGNQNYEDGIDFSVYPNMKYVERYNRSIFYELIIEEEELLLYRHEQPADNTPTLLHKIKRL